jgi:hypothetical protein
MQEGGDALIVRMLRERGFESRHDLAAIEIDMIDPQATWTSIGRHISASPHWLGRFDVQEARTFQA